MLAELARALAGRGIFQGSWEELLPLRVDPAGVVPLGVVLAQLLARPRSALAMSSRAVASYALTPEAAQRIAAPDSI